jgi:hypothetical protein
MTACAITADGTRTAPTKIASVFTIARISHLTIDSPSPCLNADLESKRSNKSSRPRRVLVQPGRMDVYFRDTLCHGLFTVNTQFS